MQKIFNIQDLIENKEEVTISNDVEENVQRMVSKNYYCFMCDKRQKILIQVQEYKENGITCDKCQGKFTEEIRAENELDEFLGNTTIEIRPPNVQNQSENIREVNQQRLLQNQVQQSSEQSVQSDQIHQSSQQNTNIQNNQRHQQEQPRAQRARVININDMLRQNFGADPFALTHQQAQNSQGSFFITFDNQMLQQMQQQQQDQNRRPANPDVINRIPLIDIDESHSKHNGEINGHLEKPCCSICLTDFELGQKAMILPCEHIYHPNCIKPWFQDKDHCPVCRTQIPLQ